MLGSFFGFETLQSEGSFLLDCIIFEIFERYLFCSIFEMALVSDAFLNIWSKIFQIALISVKAP